MIHALCQEAQNANAFGRQLGNYADISIALKMNESPVDLKFKHSDASREPCAHLGQQWKVMVWQPRCSGTSVSWICRGSNRQNFSHGEEITVGDHQLQNFAHDGKHSKVVPKRKSVKIVLWWNSISKSHIRPCWTVGWGSWSFDRASDSTACQSDC